LKCCTTEPEVGIQYGGLEAYKPAVLLVQVVDKIEIATAYVAFDDK